MTFTAWLKFRNSVIVFRVQAISIRSQTLTERFIKKAVGVVTSLGPRSYCIPNNKLASRAQSLAVELNICM